MQRLIGTGLLSVLALAAFGCAQNEMNMADMKAPPRPAELDQLEPLVGTWEGTWECTVAGTEKPIKGSGASTSAWDVDRWVMVERMTGDMGDMGKFSGIGVWTWDPKSKCFSNWWYDSWGSSSHGTSTYDAATKTFHTKGYGVDPMTGEKKSGKGTTKMIGRDKMEWTYTEYDGLGLTKTMEMKGTSTRK